MEYRDDGIFSELKDEKGKVLAHTLEHSYDKKPKLDLGAYKCVRGKHRLHGMVSDFETFEVKGVPGHTGILFHVGNFNSESDGCLLLGEGIAQSSKGQMVVGSKIAFKDFMNLMEGQNSFTLIVSE